MFHEKFTKKVSLYATCILIIGSIFLCTHSHAQSARDDCQYQINRMRDIYIVILRKIPAMPPLAKLSAGIQRALNDAEESRDSGDYKSCVSNMRRQIEIVEGYAR